MNLKKIICTLLLINGLTAVAAPLNFECDISPAPLKTDCPNDEFHSLGFYPPTDDPFYNNNPEHYANGYQWASDYMSFAYGWYYTQGTARIGINDVDVDLNLLELNNRLRFHNTGSFYFDTYNDFSDSNSTNFVSGAYPLDDPSRHGSLVMSILGYTNDNENGMSGLCRKCSFSYVSSDLPTVEFLGIGFLRDHNYFDCSTPPNNSNFNCLYTALDAALNSYEKSINYLISSGNQIINLSQSISDELTTTSNPPNAAGGNLKIKHDQREVYEPCDRQLLMYGYKQEMCDILDLAKSRDIIIVAAAGNNLKSKMDWPASNTSNVIGAAGTDPQGSLWDRNNLNGCPLSGPLSGTNGCGSNFDATTTLFAAPAENILTYHPNGDYNIGTGCLDNNFAAGNDGFQRCSGTSFATPIIASVVAMIRSINPLISFDDVKQVLWDSRVLNLADQRYAIPKANKSVKITLGNSNGTQVVNRLTPMFRMKTMAYAGWPGHTSYLSTTIPQVAAAAKLGTYLVNPQANTGDIHFNDTVIYQPDIYSPVSDGYPLLKGTSSAARAPFFVFGGHRNPFNNAADLIPLHHLARPRFSGLNGACSELADHAYSTNKQNGFLFGNNFCSAYTINYLYEGIDGYILPTCPNGVNCYENTGNANDAQCLKVRYSTQDNSFALMMASEVNEPMFASYGTSYKNRYGGMSPINTLSGMSNAECLGYVFPNIDSDSDGVIDGMELVLGTNPNSSDSDNDGLSDGVEYPLAGIPQSDPMIYDTPLCSKNCSN